MRLCNKFLLSYLTMRFYDRSLCSCHTSRSMLMTEFILSRPPFPKESGTVRSKILFRLFDFAYISFQTSSSPSEST